MATMNALVDLVTYIVLIGLLCGLLIWWLDQLGSTISEPFYRVARIAIIVVAISLIISVLLWAAASQIGWDATADEGLGASLAANLTPEEWQRALLASMQPERSPTRVVVRPDAPASALGRCRKAGLSALARQRRTARERKW
jgi:predicted RND superfamily exporter protein